MSDNGPAYQRYEIHGFPVFIGCLEQLQSTDQASGQPQGQLNFSFHFGTRGGLDFDSSHQDQIFCIDIAHLAKADIVSKAGLLIKRGELGILFSKSKSVIDILVNRDGSIAGYGKKALIDGLGLAVFISSVGFEFERKLTD